MSRQDRQEHRPEIARGDSTREARRPGNGLWLGLAASSVALGGLVVGLKYYVGRLDGNLRVVDPAEVYRSGQLTGGYLRDCLTARGIRSVVNLRGRCPSDAALDEERALCRDLAIQHLDIGLDPDLLPGPAELRALLEALDTLPRPILLHCAAGSDRTGLAAAIYLAACKGMPVDEAQASQLTWRYGHWPLWRARAMDLFFDLYRRTGRGRPLRAWILEDYARVRAEHPRGR